MLGWRLLLCWSLLLRRGLRLLRFALTFLAFCFALPGSIPSALGLGAFSFGGPGSFRCFSARRSGGRGG